VAIVGYTNAGKSTLLNTLTESEVLVENKLFATLDTRSRRLRLLSSLAPASVRFDREREIVITDTVGFIRDLPKELFAAFRATFEEAQDADLLLHVVDIADPNMEEHMQTTLKLLEELELDQVPRLLVCNKADCLPEGEADHRALLHDGIAVSALNKESLGTLLGQIEHMLFVTRSAVVANDALDVVVADSETELDSEPDLESEPDLDDGERDLYAAQVVE